MSENDYIAEYIKEEYPELLETYGFVFWKIRRTAAECTNIALKDALKIDFSKLNEAVAKMNESIKNAAKNVAFFEKSIEELKTPENPVNKGNGEDEGDAI